jgi:hypothetical protein
VTTLAPPNGFPLGNRFRRIEPVPVIAVTLTVALNPKTFGDEAVCTIFLS